MGRGRQKNDGRGRMGGRAKGTPNKATPIKKWVEELINSNRELFEDDLPNIKPYERLKVLEQLLNYVLPKQQAISQQEAKDEEYRHLEQLIKTLPDEAINQLAEKVISMQKQNSDGQQRTSN